MRLHLLIPLLIASSLFTACTNNSTPHASTPSTAPIANKLLPLSEQHRHYQPDGDFASNPLAQDFIEQMVQQHGFDREQLTDILSQAKKLDYVLNLMDKQAPLPARQTPPKPNGAWLRYRNKFLTTTSVQHGVQFWNRYATVLERAEKTYGVPAAIIIGILGVETHWGRNTGKTRIIDALTTLAFDYPRRASYFRQELESFLLMAYKEGRDPLAARGSFAGAMGYGQFMPTSYQQYAIDFDGDGHADLWNPADAIGSVAHYFQQHGWISGDGIAIPAVGQPVGLTAGIDTLYSPQQLAKAGLTPQHPVGQHTQISLLQLDTGQHYQYWYGLPNFTVITRYNHSTYYAMTVWQLGDTIANARQTQNNAQHTYPTVTNPTLPSSRSSSAQHLSPTPQAHQRKTAQPHRQTHRHPPAKKRPHQ